MKDGAVAQSRLLMLWKAFHGDLSGEQEASFLRRAEVVLLCQAAEPAVSCAFSRSPRLSDAAAEVQASERWFRGVRCRPHRQIRCLACRPMGNFSPWRRPEAFDPLIADLATSLRSVFQTIPTGAASVEVTRLLGLSVRSWAVGRGATVQCETPIDVEGVARRGYLDFLLWWQDSALAVEIDRGNKRWSLNKLAQAGEVGVAGLETGAAWVRWKGKSMSAASPPVQLV